MRLHTLTTKPQCGHALGLDSVYINPNRAMSWDWRDTASVALRSSAHGLLGTALHCDLPVDLHLDRAQF